MHNDPAMKLLQHVTADDFEYNSDECLKTYVWDEYKSAFGIRPRWMNFESMDREELVSHAVYVQNEVIDQINAEERQKHEDMLKANRKALESRKFEQNFNSLSNAFG